MTEGEGGTTYWNLVVMMKMEGERRGEKVECRAVCQGESVAEEPVCVGCASLRLRADAALGFYITGTR